MIYLLSDLHGELDYQSFNRYLEEEHSKDLLIVLGDTCLEMDDMEGNAEFTKKVLTASCPIALVDGNHENFDFLYSFPVEDWMGGKVHRLTENVVHLMRGHVFELEGKSFFVFGGCKSSDEWKSHGKWYPQEEATEEEYALAYENLKKYDHKVDYILSHKYSRELKDPYLVKGLVDLTVYIDEHVDFICWYSGHGHRNMVISDKHEMIFDELTPVEQKEG